jgi:hypothetical protein
MIYAPTPADAPLSQLAASAKFALVTDGASVLLGGQAHPSNLCVPETHIARWAGEAFLTVTHPDADLPAAAIGPVSQIEVQLPSAQRVPAIRISIQDRTHTIYADNRGNVEHSIVYNSKPAAPIIYRIASSPGLTFHRQGRISDEFADPARAKRYPPGSHATDTEIIDPQGNVWCHRDDDVLYSYAVYHDRSGNYVDEMGQEIVSYRSGQFCHILRPKWTDAKGKTCWCDQEIDAKAGTWTITWDQAWMAQAVAPLTLDPTFGNSSTGTGDTSSTSTFDTSGPEIPAEAGTLTSISAYSWYGAPVKFTMGLYDDTPSSKVGDTVEQSMPDGAFTAANCNGSPAISAVNYRFALTSDTTRHYNYNATVGYSLKYFGSYTYVAGSLPASITIANTITSYRLSVYGTYTAGGTNYTQSIADSLGVTDAPARVAAFLRGQAESEGLTDSITRAASFTRALSDAEGFTDVVDRVAAFLRALSEAQGLTDSPARVATFERTEAEAEGLTDSLSRVGTFDRALAEAQGVTDTAARLAAFERALAESEGLSDVLSRAADFTRALADSEAMTDAVVRVWQIVRGVAEEMGISDAVVSQLNPEIVTFLAAWYVILRRNQS